MGVLLFNLEKEVMSDQLKTYSEELLKLIEVLPDSEYHIHICPIDGCYLFSSNNLKEALDWCYDNLNIDLKYY